jgi:hypothetical protein
MNEHDTELDSDAPEPDAGEELEDQDGELLPRREVMSIVDLGGDGSLPVERLDTR